MAQAEAYHAGRIGCFELIASFPRLAVERAEFDPPVRIHRYVSHLIIYRAEADYVLIARVLHERRDRQALPGDG